MHRFISLTYVDHSPCILRVDGIRSINEAPGGKTEIEYYDGRRMLVREDPLSINEKIAMAPWVGKPGRILC